MRTVLFAFCVWAATVGAYSLSAQPSPRAEFSNLRIPILTMFGVMVEKAQVTLTSVGPRETFRAVGGVAKFAKIPYGEYELDVQLAGFEARRERITVYQPEVEYRVGLKLGYPSDPERPEIIGSVSGGSERLTDLWVRLVPLFSGGLIENTVDRVGSFRLTGMTPGNYVLLLFQGNQLLGSKPLEFLGGRPTLTIDAVAQKPPLPK